MMYGNGTILLFSDQKYPIISIGECSNNWDAAKVWGDKFHI